MMAGLDWEPLPLVNRRRAFRMFMFYKMHSSGLVATHPTLYLTPRQYHTSHKYYIPHSRIDQRAFLFFPTGTVRLWNKLPATTAYASPLNVFKARVALLKGLRYCKPNHFNTSTTHTCRLHKYTHLKKTVHYHSTYFPICKCVVKE